MPRVQDRFAELCAACSLTFGGHRSGADQDGYLHNQCPGHEGYMDWDESPGTVFVPTGIFLEVPRGTPAKVNEVTA